MITSNILGFHCLHGDQICAGRHQRLNDPKILYLALLTYDIGMSTLQGQHPFINIQFELIIYFWNWLRLIKNDQKGLNSNNALS